MRTDTRRSTRDRAVDVACVTLAVLVAVVVLMAELEPQRASGAYLLMSTVLAVIGCGALWWRRRWPVEVAVLLLVLSVVTEFVGGAMLGANSFLLKDTPPRDLLESVRKVAAGETVLSPSVITRLVDHVVGDGGRDERQHRGERARAALDGLTDREREVAASVGEGKSNAEISADLHMSVATVKTYVSRLLTKLGCDNRVQVATLVHEARG